MSYVRTMTCCTRKFRKNTVNEPVRSGGMSTIWMSWNIAINKGTNNAKIDTFHW